MTDELIVRGQLSHALTGALHRSNQGLRAVPELLLAAIEQRAWEQRVIVETGEVFPGFSSFDEWCCAPPPKGLGATTSLIDGFAKDNRLLRDLLDQARQNPVGTNQHVDNINTILRDLLDQARQNPHGGDRRSEAAQIEAAAMSSIKSDNVTLDDRGNSDTYALRRLRKDRPDLHARVLAGELSPHGAMVAVGYSLPGSRRLCPAAPHPASVAVLASDGGHRTGAASDRLQTAATGYPLRPCAT